jgi:hypothetical protein
MNLLELTSKIVGAKAACSVFGHRIVEIRKVTNHFREYECTCCKIKLTNDLYDRKTFLTPELKEINETLLSHYNRRVLSA